MESSTKTIVWFRRDLRIEDNSALVAAAREGGVFPVFIWCPKEEAQFYPGRVSRWWLKQSLIHLEQSLRSLGSALVLIKTQSTLTALQECISAVGATKVVYNHLYDPISLVRDHNIKQKLGELGVSVQSYNGDLLHEPWEVYNEKGQVFTTFDTYWENCLQMQGEPPLELPPWRLIPVSGSTTNCSVEELGLEDDLEKSSNALLARAWSPGWCNAEKGLTEFVENHLLDYSKSRQNVSGNASSLLSPYLHFGEISVRKVFHCVRIKQIQWAREGNSTGETSANFFLRAIGLREYSRYICFNFPFTHENSLLGNLKYFPWKTDQVHFKAWRQGRTGYPLVDAGMRELWATGWIHNRIRVIVSSFFVKFLLLPWQWGMKYFWDTLLDADLESDILGWQYISGSLPDGHKLERLDSPEVQGFKFDPEGEYVRQWLPELARMPVEWIHHPWDAPSTVLRAAGVDIGLNYPKPIVDIDVARDHLAEAIAIMQEREATSRATNNGANEVVFDNSNIKETSEIPKVVKQKNPCPGSSYYDQKVPSLIQKSENCLLNNKRLRTAIEGPMHEKQRNCNSGTGSSKIEDDLCSTAESSATKKQNTSSRYSFSVPQFCSLSSNSKPRQDCESHDFKEPWQEDTDAEQNSGKEGATGS